jgi:transposase-like protein
LFAKGGKRCREILCVGVCLFYILNEEVQRKEIVEIRKIIDSNDTLSKGYRFPAEMISHCVWWYFRFSLSFRDVEEIMAERGVELTYETIRQWCLKFGQQSANGVKRSHPHMGDKWHQDARLS